MADCYFCKNNIKEIDYKDTDLLRQFLSSQGKILSRKKSGNCAKHQRKIAKLIKRARHLGLLPYIIR